MSQILLVARPITVLLLATNTFYLLLSVSVVSLGLRGFPRVTPSSSIEAFGYRF